jgi:hypothetical protein
MNRFLLIFCLFFVSLSTYSQTCCTPEQACNFRSISVGSGTSTSLTLRHVGPASITPTAGQQSNWIVGTTTNPNITNVTTTAANGVFTFNLTSLGISTTDIIVATCNIISTSGSVCSINNQNIEWTPLGTPPFQTFLWRATLPTANGVFQAPLPVEWISFDGKSNQGDNHLFWTTAAEINNEGYAIQVSNENSSWETIGFVNGKGNTSSISEYNFIHRNVPKQLLYYKLIQVDYDGRTNESRVIALDNADTRQDLADFEIYPNPSTGKSTIDLGQVPIGSFDLNIYNSIGQLIESKKHKDINRSTIGIDLPLSGLYFIQIYKDGKRQTKRFIVE